MYPYKPNTEDQRRSGPGLPFLRKMSGKGRQVGEGARDKLDVSDPPIPNFGVAGAGSTLGSVGRAECSGEMTTESAVRSQVVAAASGGLRIGNGVLLTTQGRVTRHGAQFSDGRLLIFVCTVETRSCHPSAPCDVDPVSANAVTQFWCCDRRTSTVPGWVTAVSIF